jgi:Fe-S oxidoreductase
MNLPFFPANREAFEKAGLAAPDPQGRPPTLQALLAEYRQFSRSFALLLDCCTRCGACNNSCHSFLGTEEPLNTPLARIDLLSRGLDRPGRRKTRRRDVPDQLLETWLARFYQCNLCRRCAQACPLGLDPSEIVMAGRHILSELGLAPRFLLDIAANLHRHGNNMGINREALHDICGFLEEELLEETGLPIAIPIDRQGAQVLYVPSSSEFFTNVDTLLGVAKIFFVLGVDWTLSCDILEAANYGLFLNRRLLLEHHARLRQTARKLAVPTVVQGECGHGWRAIRMLGEQDTGRAPFRLAHILDFCAVALKRLTIQPLPWRVTLHDSCNYARSGNLMDSPRKILRACTRELVEMSPNREANYCCGGGGGLLMEEMKDIRIRLGKLKAEQLRQLLPLDYLAIPCASCRAHFPLILESYGLQQIHHGGVVELLGKTLVLPPPTASAGQP